MARLPAATSPAEGVGLLLGYDSVADVIVEGVDEVSVLADDESRRADDRRKPASEAAAVERKLTFDYWMAKCRRTTWRLLRDLCILSTYFIDELYPHFLIRDGRVGLFPEAGT